MIRGCRDEQRLGSGGLPRSDAAVGLSSLLWGRSAWEAASGLLPSGVGAGAAAADERLAHLHGRASMPRIDPRPIGCAWTGWSSRPTSLSLAELQRAPDGRAGERLPLRDGMERRGRAVDRGADPGRPRRREPRSRRPVRSRSCRPSDPTSTRSRSTRHCSRTSCSRGRWTVGPLPRPHGAPLRLVVPAMYGYKSVKWVDRIVVTREPRRRVLGAAGLRPRRVGRPLERRVSRARYVRRFSRTERAVHWVHASAFFVLLASGLVLYLPSLAAEVGRRPLVKDVHLLTALAWVLALLAVLVVGDRRGLRATARELDVFDADDRRWLLGRRRAAGTVQRRAEAERGADRRVRAALRGLGSAALARRARHALPPRRHHRPPRRASPTSRWRSSQATSTWR